VRGDLGRDQVDELCPPGPATQHDQMWVRNRDDALIARTTRAASAATTPAGQVVAVGGIDVRMIHDAASSTTYLLDIPGSRAC
jgi:hypothetical protein